MATKDVKVEFALTGFRQENSIRVFLFENRPMEGPATKYTVSADLALARRYGIPIQELGLACRGFLEQHKGASELQAIVFDDEQMNIYADACKVARKAALLSRKRISVSNAATVNDAVTAGSSRMRPRKTGFNKSFLPQSKRVWT